MNKQEISELTSIYINAWENQRKSEENFNKALKTFNEDNEFFTGVNTELEKAYNALLKAIIGEDNFEWVDWWMYESNYGKVSLGFMINSIEYNTTDLSLEEFLNIVIEDN